MRPEHWLYTIPLRLRSLFRRGRVEQELDEELRDHVERQIGEHVARGMTPEAARRAALRALGGVEQRKEECRDARRVGFIEDAGQDVRYGLSVLRRSPGFTAVAVGSLALGIGANTAIFQLIDAVRLRSLPLPNPQELAEVQVAGSYGGMGISNGFNSQITNPLWEEIRGRQEAFSGAFAWGDDMMRLGRGARSRRVRVMWVSGEAFSVLGVNPERGRLLDRGDDRRGCGPSVAVVSHAFWQGELGRREDVVGSKVVVQDRPLEVVGVTPPAFFGLEVGTTFEIAMPICAQAVWGDAVDRRDVWWLSVMGRLRPQWTLAQASRHLDTISPALFAATVPSGYSATTEENYRKLRLEAVRADTGVSGLRRMYDTSLWLLLGITGLVLLIACANLANLMLARASAREREMAVRLALGASRPRLLRQLLTESLLLAAGGAALGAGLAHGLCGAIVSLVSTQGDPLRLDLSADGRVLAFTATVAVLTCVVFGLSPALRSSRTEPGAAMRTGGRGLTSGRERLSFQRLLVVMQIAVSLVLLVGALLMAQSFRNLMSVDPGFRQEGILVVFLDMSGLPLPAARREGFRREVAERIRALPQVDSVATTSNPPLIGGSWTMAIRVEGAEREATGNSKVTWVSPGYFRTMEIPLLAGRDFDDRDTEASRRVAMVNQTFVRRFLGTADPMGRTFRTGAEPNYPEAVYEIVGVVRDTKYQALRADVPPSAFAPAPQHPNPRPGGALVIRSSAPLAGVTSSVKREVGALYPEVYLEAVVFQEEVQAGLLPERIMAALTGFFGALATALAMIGLYDVVSYLVAKRRNEIGVRMALGAASAEVLRMVLKDGLRLVLAGIAIGVPATLAITRLASALLFGVSPADPLTIAAATLLMITVAALAGFLPARRASRLDPMVALRHE